MELSVDDLIVNSTDAFRGINYRLLRKTGLAVRTYGKNAIDLDNVMYDPTDTSNLAQAQATARFIVASADYTARLIEQLPAIAVALINSETHTFKHAGISATWNAIHLRDYVNVNVDLFDRLLDGLATRDTTDPESTFRARLLYHFNDKRLSNSYTGDASNSTLSRALWIAKRNFLISSISDNWVGARTGTNGLDLVIEYANRPEGKQVPFDSFAKLNVTINQYLLYKPDMIALRNYRDELLDDQRHNQARIDIQRRNEASAKFRNYWNDLKNNQVAQTSNVADAQLLAVPLQPAGTSSSRTWGIEIETVRFNETSRPPGWEDKYDGSLPGDDNECSCDCDDCYEGDNHCQDNDYSCYYDDAEINGSRELVSPILNSFNSNGLRQICDDLGTRENEHSAPGIHVHVGASDMTIFDVTRLLVGYSAVERLITPILHRKVRGYCVETATDTLRWWLAKAREYRNQNPDRIPTAVDIIRQHSSAAPSRYVDVNLQSLTTHGTIEFRAMGAWYSYDHLVRWAWLVREMVNVSKLGIDQSEWTSCRSMADVVTLLQKYGSEIPSSALVAELKSADLDLSAEEEEELLSVVG